MYAIYLFDSRKSKKSIVETWERKSYIAFNLIARMAELADALASGASGRKVVGVQLPLRAHF